MKNILNLFSVLALLVFAAGLEITAVAESTKETVGEAASDTKKAVKKGYRKAKDKGCEMVNGKLECAAKKMKHGLENAGDEVSDKIDDLKK